MGTVYGAIKTIALAATADHTNPPGAGEGAMLRVTQDTYEANALASESVIEIGSKMRKNAYVYEVICGYDALGSSTSISVGDYEDADRYITNTATTSASVTRLNTVNGMNYKADETNSSTSDLQITATLVDSGAATGTIKVTVFWA